MRKIWVIAVTTFRELIREKFFLVIVFVAIFLIALSVLLGELSFNEAQKILADIGFSAMQISSVGLALFIGSYMLSREVEKQTCLLMLSRPISRTEFLFGKFFGIVLLIVLLNLTLPLAILALLAKWEWLGSIYQIAINLCMEALVVLSIVYMMSVILRPILAVLTGVVLFLSGHWLGEMDFFIRRMKDPMMLTFSECFKLILPNFYRFNWKNYFSLESGLSALEMRDMLLHYTSWIVLMLVFSVALFRRKDIV